MHEHIPIPFINSNAPKIDGADPEHIKWLLRMNMALYEGQYQSCFRKKKYASPEKAQKRIYERHQLNKVIYPCPHCNFWHIGRNRDDIINNYEFKVTRLMVLNINYRKKFKGKLLMSFNELLAKKEGFDGKRD